MVLWGILRVGVLGYFVFGGGVRWGYFVFVCAGAPIGYWGWGLWGKIGGCGAMGRFGVGRGIVGVLWGCGGGTMLVYLGVVRRKVPIRSFFGAVP